MTTENKNEMQTYQAPSMTKHDPVKAVQGSGEVAYCYSYYYYYKVCCYDYYCYYYYY